MVSFLPFIPVVISEKVRLFFTLDDPASSVGQNIERSLVGNLWGSRNGVWALLFSFVTIITLSDEKVTTFLFSFSEAYGFKNITAYHFVIVLAVE